MSYFSTLFLQSSHVPIQMSKPLNQSNPDIQTIKPIQSRCPTQINQSKIEEVWKYSNIYFTKLQK